MDERFGADRGRRDAGNVGVRAERRRRRDQQRRQRLQRRHQDTGHSRRRHEGHEVAVGEPELEHGHEVVVVVAFREPAVGQQQHVGFGAGHELGHGRWLVLDLERHEVRLQQLRLDVLGLRRGQHVGHNVVHLVQ